MQEEIGAGARCTRRELIAGAVTATGAGVLVAAPAASADPPVTDASLLSAALQYERLAIRAYDHVLTLSLFTDPERRLLCQLRGHDTAHVSELERELLALGDPLPPPPTADSQVDRALSAHRMSGQLDSVRTREAAIYLLLDIVALCEGAYYTAVGQLNDVPAAGRAAQALACEGQHSTLLSALLPKADIGGTVPAWYVTGVT
jgi:hypothetical protein